MTLSVCSSCSGSWVMVDIVKRIERSQLFFPSSQVRHHLDVRVDGELGDNLEIWKECFMFVRVPKQTVVQSFLSHSWCQISPVSHSQNVRTFYFCFHFFRYQRVREMFWVIDRPDLLSFSLVIVITFDHPTLVYLILILPTKIALP